MTENLLSFEQALLFILGGKAIFTLKSIRTGKRFTYKVTTPRDQNKDDSTVYFVSALTGPNNLEDYTYIGFIKMNNSGYWEFRHGTRKSSVSVDALSVQAFDWSFRRYAAKMEAKEVECWHVGRCCRCGRALTDDVSIKAGIGPECATRKKKAPSKVNATLL